MAIRTWEQVPDLMTRKELSEFTGIAIQTFARWMSEGNAHGPKALKLGGAVRYSKDAVRDWIESAEML